MEDAGYRPPKIRRREHTGRFEAVRPNHMWHLDFVQRWIGRASTFTLILIDDHSRFVVGHGVDDAERADLVIDTFEQAVTRYGRPEMVMHDKGSAFWSWKGISRFSRLLEEMGIEYIGPVDGHDLKSLIETLELAKSLNKPVLIHTQTTKGKGYEIAEGKYEKWHGVGPFDLESGSSTKKSSAKSATQIYSEALMRIASDNEKVVGVTAAMPSGTGLGSLIEAYPDRFWDVAIAEQHAVTSMGELAAEGFKPFCTIYSTFLQRGYAQVIHDICLMDLPVVFALDRAGIVGEDGETHQGIFDISFLRAIPNMTLFAPRDERSLNQAVDFAAEYMHTCAFRYPRGSFIEASLPESQPFQRGKSQMLVSKEGELLFIGYGNGVGRAAQTMNEMGRDDISLLDLRFVKPLDKDMLRELALKHSKWFVFSDSTASGGVGSAILEFLAQEKIDGVSLSTFEYDDRFITHGNTRLVEESLGLLPGQLAKRIDKIIK
jgi:1-deoxy-D-xylulose-5-phosphate synthase